MGRRPSRQLGGRQRQARLWPRARNAEPRKPGNGNQPRLRALRLRRGPPRRPHPAPLPSPGCRRPGAAGARRLGPPVCARPARRRATPEWAGPSRYLGAPGRGYRALRRFLGSLVKKVGGAVSGFAKSSIGKTIGGALKAVAKKALPMVSGALGTFVGGPLGTALGSKLGSMAGNLFELELEGLSPEDQEFETARAFVRFANSAVQRGAAAAQNPRRNVPPAVAARKALTSAAMQHAPGLLRPRNANGTFRSM
nr:hypothetical protein [Tanacetum cinerariifolium]